MLYSIKYRDDLKKIEELASIQNQVKVLRLQDNLGLAIISARYENIDMNQDMNHN